MIRQSQRNNDLHLLHIRRTDMQNKYRSEYGKTRRVAWKERWNVKGIASWALWPGGTL
jgi:hypothetical protein